MKKESLTRGGSLSLAGSGFAAIAALVLTALISNGFGASGTGVFFQAVAIFTVLSQVLRLGTNSAIVRFISAREAVGHGSGAWKVTALAVVPVLAVSTLAATALVLFAEPWSVWLSPPGRATELEALLVAMAPFVVVSAVLSVLHTITRMVRGIAAFTVLQSVLLPITRLAAVVLVLVTGLGGADLAFVAWMIVLPFWLVVTIAVLWRPLLADHRMRHTGLTYRQFWSFSGPRAVGASLETALDWSDVVVVAALTSPAEAGIYAVGTRTVRAGQIIDRAMRITASPRISALFATSEQAEITTLHTSVARFMIIAAWPYYLTLALFGTAVLSIFGEGFERGAIVLAVLAAAMMVSAASGMLQSVLLQGGRSSWQMYNKAIVLTINLTLNLVLVPMLGILGAAISWVVSLTVDMAIAAWQVHRLLGVRLEPLNLLPAAAAPLLVFGGGWLIIRAFVDATPVTLLLGLLVLGVIYLAVLRLLKVPIRIEAVRRIGRDRSLAASANHPPDRAGQPSPADRG